MYSIFEQLLQKNDITPYKLSKETGIATSTLSDWKNGKSVPKLEKLQKIADYFNVSVDYLMGGEEKDNRYYLNDETAQIAQEIFDNPDMKSLFDMSRKMSPDRLKAHLEFMKKLYDDENR